MSDREAMNYRTCPRCLSIMSATQDCTCDATRTPTNTADLAEAVQEFEAALPGWWWSVTHCVWTRDADCGPDARVLGMEHPHVRAFDDGFHEARQGTLADALRSVLQQAKEAIDAKH